MTFEKFKIHALSTRYSHNKKSFLNPETRKLFEEIICISSKRDLPLSPPRFILET